MEKRFAVWCIEVIKKMNESPSLPRGHKTTKRDKERDLREQIEKTKAQLECLKESLAELEK